MLKLVGAETDACSPWHKAGGRCAPEAARGGADPRAGAYVLRLHDQSPKHLDKGTRETTNVKLQR